MRTYKRGPLIKTARVYELWCRHNHFIYWHKKIMHVSFLSSMPYRVVIRCLTGKIIRKAFKKEGQ